MSKNYYRFDIRTICFLFTLFLLFLSAVPKSYASVLFEDDFNDTNGTQLSAHNQKWQGYPGLNYGIINNNQVQSSNNSNSRYFLFSYNNLTDYCVQANFSYPLPQTQIGDFFDLNTRMNTTQPTHDYNLSINTNNNLYFSIDYSLTLFSQTINLSSGTHTAKLCSVGSKHSIYIDNNIITTVTDSTYSSGAPGFDLGNNTPIDNFIVTSATPAFLSVPYFNQNSLPWGTTEYDHAKMLGANDSTMQRWGCAVTSVAMVLNYHGITQFADGTPIDPGSLNEWLNDPKNNGYLYGYGMNGWYSYLDWASIGTLTQNLYDAGKSPVKLEYNAIVGSPTQQAKTTLDNDLMTGNDLGSYPDILWVSNASTSGHFVVAKGVEGNTYTINDPEWNVTDLSSFNNTYMQIGRYIPSHSNLSYLNLVVNPDVEILVTDPQNRKTGNMIQNGQMQSFNEIPNASYEFAPPISNPDNHGKLEQLGTGVNEFLLPKPIDGNYIITLSSKTNQYYTINIASFEQNGMNNLNKIYGLVDPNMNNNFTIDFSQTNQSSAHKSVTFETTIRDIQDAQKLHLLNKVIADGLIITVKNAQRQFGKHNDVTKKLLDLGIKLLKQSNNHSYAISPIAYSILLDDFTTLESSIQ
ncbi:MAG TPA: C39 family peptidase [Candidatus Acidoferrales bacterium]|nr:C39 family peptidase [Candidatus Acidoferrales bacterium]